MCTCIYRFEGIIEWSNGGNTFGLNSVRERRIIEQAREGGGRKRVGYWSIDLWRLGNCYPRMHTSQKSGSDFSRQKQVSLWNKGYWIRSFYFPCIYIYIKSVRVVGRLRSFIFNWKSITLRVLFLFFNSLTQFSCSRRKSILPLSVQR